MKNPDASIYFGGIAIGAANGAIKRCSYPSKLRPFLLRYGFKTIGQPSSFYCRRTYHKVGGIDRTYFHRMDADLWLRLIQENSEIETIPVMLSMIRFHEAAKSATAAPAYLKERQNFLESMNLSNPLKYRTIQLMFRTYRMIDGSYLRSWQATRLYKDKRMQDFWSEMKYDYK